MKNTKIIILAGGKGTRLPESAKEKPKPLVEILGKPMLQHQIEHLLSHGLRNISLSLGWRADQIIAFVKNHYPFIKYVVENEPRGTGGAIKFAIENHDKPFIAMNGDIIADCNWIEFIKKSLPYKNSIMITETKDARDFGLVEIKRGRITEFKEKPQVSMPGLVNVGFYFLDPEEVKKIDQEKFSIENELFPRLAREKRLHYYLHNGFWIDAGTEDRLKAVNNSSFSLI